MAASASRIPFDSGPLDRLMDEAGIDVLLATSKHNVQYLLGGHRAFFFDYMDAMGLSRYLPIMLYPKGAPDKAAFFGHRLENFQREVEPAVAFAADRGPYPDRPGRAGAGHSDHRPGARSEPGDP